MNSNKLPLFLALAGVLLATSVFLFRWDRHWRDGTGGEPMGVWFLVAVPFAVAAIGEMIRRMRR